ncbi:MAG: PKD domain-containing protein [Chitinophagaceae bacterium]
MDTNQQIKDSINHNGVQLPMGQLFYLLYANGFSVKPDDYIEMLKITERFGSTDLDETARWICPLIATTETEQAKFYNIVEQYKKLNNAAEEIERQKKKRRSIGFRWFLAISGLALLLLIIYLSLPVKTYQLQETNPERSVEKGVPLSFDASNLLLDHPEDTSKIQFNWQFEDGSKQEGIRTVHVFNKPGDYTVKRQFSSKSIALPKKGDSLLVHVCNDLPKVNIVLPDKAVTASEPVTINANIDADTGTVSYYRWSINDSSFNTDKPVAENILFVKKGDYDIKCTAVVGSIGSPCSATDDEIIHVQDNGVHYTASFSAVKPGDYAARKTQLKWWVSFFMLIPATIAIAYSVFKRKPTTVKVTQSVKPATEPVQGPYDVPFEQNDTKLVQQERELRSSLLQMRYKAEEENLVLSVPATINAIIQSGGSPQLVFAPMSQQQEYLLLIDGSNPRSMITRLFGYLAKCIQEEGIPVSIFYYDKNFTCFNDKFPSGLTLQRLAETYSASILIIAGKAQELVYSAYPVIEEKFLKELNQWQHKAIVTPTPVKDWGVKEKVLQEYLILVPADTLSLQKLIPALREKTRLNTKLLETTGAEQNSLHDIDFREPAVLKSYLENDETMFQWLCAICIYPRLRWEVLIEVGKVILDKYGEPEKLNYTNLLKLCRISWMQQGVFPQTTRLELLKNLTVENEVCAREQLLHMLNYSTGIYGESGYFFEEEKRRQQITNQFVLNANDPQQYKQYASSKEAFKKIWKDNSLLDVPVKKYLDKSGEDNWQTPLTVNNQSVGLTTYFDQQETKANNKQSVKRSIAALMGIALLATWSYIAFGGGARKLSPYISLTQDIGQQAIPVSIKVIKYFNQCGDSLKNSFDKIDGYVSIGSEKIPLAYNRSTAIASFDLPYESLARERGEITLAWDSNKSVIAPLLFASQRIPDTLTIGCISINAKIPLNIRYNDTSGYKEIEGVLANALFQYRTYPEQVNFTDSSRIIYYEPNQKQRADSIVAIIKESLDIDVKEEYIREIRVPPAVPILFLNTAADTASIEEANKASAYDYHGLGDEAFRNEKYQDAINSYKRAVFLNPKDALAYYQMGVCYEMLGDAYISKALEVYDAAIRINSSDGLYWYRRAMVKYQMKRYADAIPDFTKTINLRSEDTQNQYGNAIYFRGKAYYFIKNMTNACTDFKRSGDLGVKAGKQDYTSYCSVNNANNKPDCNKTFYSLKDALSVDAAVICNLDLSADRLTTIPRQVYGFKNLSQLNLGTTNVSQQEINQLQKALPSCKISYSFPVQQQQQQQAQTEKEYGYIELDQNGYTNAAGQQVMEKVSRLLKTQPQGKVRLTASYTNSEEQKQLSGYMNTITNMFAKIGVDPKTQIEQRIIKDQEIKQQQQNAPANVNKTVVIQVTGINLNEYPNLLRKKS